MISNANYVAMYCSLCMKPSRGILPDNARYNWAIQNEPNFPYMNQLYDQLEQLVKEDGWVFIERPGPDAHVLVNQTQVQYRMNNTKYVCRPCALIIGKALGVKIPVKSFLPKEPPLPIEPKLMKEEKTPLIDVLEDEKAPRKRAKKNDA
jgi:hypothetical protein